MFSRQKTQIDIKKSTQKILDRKKDTPTKLKHLRLVLDSFDSGETKSLFCTHYEPIYKIVYEGIVSAEANLKHRGAHRAQREELEGVLFLLEKILILCPDNLHGRWQLHSLSRLMAKLNHPGNSTRLRREGMRLFLIWYQCLGKNAPNYIHKMFSSMVPGFGPSLSSAWPPPAEEAAMGVAPLEINPIVPVSSTEKQPEDPSSYFLECILDFMVSQSPKIHWNDGPEMWTKCIDFLYERFKEFYLPQLFPNFKVVTDIYKPALELPEPRKKSDMATNLMYTCQVVFIKWIANYAHSVYRSTDCFHPTNVWHNRNSIYSHHEESLPNTKIHASPHSSLSGDRDSITSYSSIPSDVDPNVLAKDVIMGNRENINLLHEIFRRALLLPFAHSAAIRRVICVYKDWIQINVPELPVFILEPDDGDISDQNSEWSHNNPKTRLRSDSYYGAVGLNSNNNNREVHLYHLRAGLQKMLRVFFCNAAAVFLRVHIPKNNTAGALLEEQVDICKRVLNIYRYAVMNTTMDHQTWEQLLIVMLHITGTTLLDANHLYGTSKCQDSLGQKLSSAMFQTLIVSWVKASLNVPILVELWDQLQTLLSQLTVFDELVTEWAKTMETLTRVLARHVYNLDLTSLPLERLTEQKAKRKRGIESGGSSKKASIALQVSIPERKRHISHGTSPDSKAVADCINAHSQRKTSLSRSFSESNISNRQKNRFEGTEAPDSKSYLLRKMSKSVDSLHKSAPKESVTISSITVPHALDWAEISSSTASLETASNIHCDGDSISGSHLQPGKEELKGVIAGGKTKGWLPSVAVILWKRMLGVLGNVNEFSNPRTQAHFFQILTDMWTVLHKIRKNQGVSLDNLTTPTPPELVPPLLLPAPWCFEALELPDDFHKGKVLACSLLCDITLANQDISLDQEYLTKFYSTIHKSIITNNQYILNEIVKRCGPKFISKMLPGFSILIFDLVQTSHGVLRTDDLRNTPRVEASTLLGTILGLSDVFEGIQVLKPNLLQFHPVQANSTKLVISYLIQTAKLEQTSNARAIALQSLTIYLCNELMKIRKSRNASLSSEFSSNPAVDEERHSIICDIFSIVIASVQVSNRSVALVAADLLLALSEFVTEVATHFSSFFCKVITVLKWRLENAIPLKQSMLTSSRPREIEKRLFISLLVTLGEWCMKTPIEILLNPSSSTSTSFSQLLSSVFEVLQMVVTGSQTRCVKTLPVTLEDFDQNVEFDDMQSLENRNKVSPSGSSDTADAIHDFQTVKLAARFLISHLLTQLGHFPISSSAARCCSIVSENDDLGVEENEFSSHIFSLPNVQLFAMDDENLLTLVELPSNDNSDYGEPELNYDCRANKNVRIILRDLSGKACWDAMNLSSGAIGSDSAEAECFSRGPNLNAPEDYCHSALTGSFFPQVGPRLTVRHRHAGNLPTVENSADDLDNLDDLLEYIAHSSPECLLKPGEPLTAPCDPPGLLGHEQEDEVIASVVSQRSLEYEYLGKVDLDVTIRAKALQLSDFSQDERGIEECLLSLGNASKNCAISNFLLSRKLFSQLGLTGSEKRAKMFLLNKDEKLLRELKHLDSQKCRESHKIAVIYVAHGQEDKQSILYNTAGSEAFEDFVSGLGWEVELENHTGFMGGLQRNKSSGETAPYFATSFAEVIFHVATRLPSNSEESLLQKTRHLGNDEVHVVWSEHYRDYRRDIIPTEFCDVLIVIYPLQYGLFRIQISKKPEVPYFGPLYNEAVVAADVLPCLVRATAVNASRARRSSLPFFQYHFQERSKALSTIINHYKISTTFEQFAGNVFSPLLPSASFISGANSRASATSFTSTLRASGSSSNSSHLASALTDHSITMQSSAHSTGPPRRMTMGPSFISSSSSISPYENVTVSPTTGRFNQSQHFAFVNESTTSSAPVSPIPVPPKRHTVKLSSSNRPKIPSPPASPATSLRSNPGSIK